MAQCLYLVSSSASRKYVADCLATLSLPRGMVHHFRYRRNYLAPDLARRLTSRPNALASSLRDVPVLVLYRFQERQPDDRWVVRDHVPLRWGTLVDAYLEGEIAHVFFAVGPYVYHSQRGSTPRQRLQDLRCRIGGAERYAFVAPALISPVERWGGALGFQSFVEDAFVPNEWRTMSAGTAPLDISYDVIFYRVDGLFRETAAGGLTSLPPTRRRLPGWPFAEYALDGGSTYHLKIATHISRPVSPAQLPGQGRVKLKLQMDPDLFTPEGPTELRVLSAYDVAYWPIRATEVSRPTCGTLAVVPDHDIPFEWESYVRSEILCTETILPVRLL